MNIIVEGLILAALLYLFCCIGIRNGAVALVHLYERDVQERAVELGLITNDKIRRNAMCFKLAGVAIYLIYPIVCVYWINGARGFWEGFWQITVILLMMGVFDPEDFMPYIPVQVHVRKWIMTLTIYPAAAAILSGILSLVLK